VAGVAGNAVPDWVQSILLLASLGAIAYLMARQASEAARMAEQERVQAFTEIECGDGSRKTREFRSGDFVGGEAADCPGGRVVGIYTVKVEEEKAGRRGLIPVKRKSKS